MEEKKKHEHKWYPTEVYVCENLNYAIVRATCIDEECPDRNAELWDRAEVVEF